MMNWWIRFCDKVVEKVTGSPNNAGHFGFRTNCMVVWFGAMAVGMAASAWYCTSPLGVLVFLAGSVVAALSWYSRKNA